MYIKVSIKTYTKKKEMINVLRRILKRKKWLIDGPVSWQNISCEKTNQFLYQRDGQTWW